MTQPTNAAAVTVNALASTQNAAGVASPATTASATPAATTGIKAAATVNTSGLNSSTSTVPVPGQISDKNGNPAFNGNVPIGIPGAAPAANVCQIGILDYFNCGNYANSPLPELDGTGNPVPGTGIRKFVDTLPGVGKANANDLGVYIPVATPGSATLADGTVDTKADFYNITLNRFTQQVHADLPPTIFQGYRDSSSAASDPTQHYLGPIIFAQRNRPVRVQFTNALPTSQNGGTSYIPVDTTMRGDGTGPLGGTENYPQNRALLHLHGGITPWISDGTPHQWIAPANDASHYKKGASQTNVPDMVAPAADGSSGWDTWYYTNEQSARMLWYHDHSYGMTRQDVYAGEAAPYIITDPIEEDLIDGKNRSGLGITASVLPDNAGLNQDGSLSIPIAGDTATTSNPYRHGIPLVIQDKTFVPPTTATVTSPLTLGAPGNTYLSAYTMDQMSAEDPTWFGYTDRNGNWQSVFGQDDPTYKAIEGQFGQLWFPHVFMPNQNPNIAATGVNGYGRWDYGAWVWPPVSGLQHPPLTGQIDPVTGASITIPPFPNPSAVQEAFMDTPVINGTAYPKITVGKKAYRFRVLNAANDRHWNLQLYYAVDANGNPCNSTTSNAATCTEVKMIPAVPTAGEPNGTNDPRVWPTDGRDGGVPDWNLSGPPIIQIGTDSGLLPSAYTIPSQPINYEYNRRVITALNVKEHSLLLGPAERADIVVDFSNVPDGSVLIMYNDAPAPLPGFDSRLDYYTGDPDQSSSGGAPTTLPGYGPNTRTVMQFIVSAAADSKDCTAACTFDVNAFNNVMKSVYATEQHNPLVPETAYGNSSTDNYAKIDAITYDMTTNQFVPANTSTGQDSVINMKPKAIAEEFDTDWGRMTAQLGVEMPFTNFLTQTTVQMWMFDPPTEVVDNLYDPTTGGIQIWKITHNGVDTHSVHFHMFDVQLINRVAWDGTMYPPDPNEVGWKETVRMNPLTDTIIALRPIVPTLPFSLPDSFRPLDPTSPIDPTPGVATATTPAFTNIDPLTNNPITVSNQLTNFGWEYVWHCHLLGHEENDMMRPIVVEVKPETPASLATQRNSSKTVDLTWVNNAASASGFVVRRAEDAGFTVNVKTITASAPSVTTSSQLPVGTVGKYTDSTALPTVKYYYQVAAAKLFNNPVESNGVLTSDWSGSASVDAVPAPVASVAPPSLTFPLTVMNSSAAGQAVVVSNIGTDLLHVSKVALSGPNAGDFKVANACTAAVAANANCALTVTFAPAPAATAGARSAALTFSTDDTLHPSFSIPLSGSTTALNVSPAALVFGTVAVGRNTTSPVTLTNQGTSRITLNPGFTFSGTNPGDFSQTNRCANGIVAGGSCTVTVRFAPIATTLRSAVLNIGTSDAAGPRSVSLTGNASPAITVSPVGPIAVGSSNIGTSLAVSPITVTSSGNYPVSGLAISLTGSGAADYSQTNNCPATLPNGSSCIVNVVFNPTQSGPRSATLSVAVSAPATSKNVTLNGTGIPNTQITITPDTSKSPYRFGVKARGSSTMTSFTVTSTGPSAVTFPPTGSTAVTGDTANFSVTGNSCAGSTLSTTQTCTVSVTFTAPSTANTTVNGTVTVTPTNAAPQAIYVRGSSSIK